MTHTRLCRALLAWCWSLLLCLACVWPAQAFETDDLIWPRMAAGMRLVDSEHPETVTHARQYARHPERFNEMLQRSEPFLWYIVEAVELREMPLELALMPAVESGFDPQARSSQRARGLWQFVPATGAHYGLRESVNYDARRDPIASTRAALRYLDRLKISFGQDWLLALAAYNGGEARVRRALVSSALPRAQFWDLAALPAQTRDYVPRLLGVALLIREPERFGLRLPRIYNRQSGELVALDRPRDLASAARNAGVSAELLRRYNPGLKEPRNSGAKKTVLLPRPQAVALRHELQAAAYPPQRVRLPDSLARHVVAAGDTLWDLSRRYGVSVRDLAEWNELKSGQGLRIGAALVVSPQS